MIYLHLLIFILTAICFYIIVKHNNYELNFKESILCNIYLLTIFFIKHEIIIFNIICLYYILLLIYYIIRSYKLKKYIPINIIVGYIILTILNVIAMFFISYIMTEFNGFDWLFIIIFFIIYSVIYIILLLLVNLIMYIKGNEKKYNFNNKNYKINKLVYINVIIILIITFILFLKNT